MNLKIIADGLRNKIYTPYLLPCISRATVFCTLKSRITIFVLFLLCGSFMHTLTYCQIANSGMYSQTARIGLNWSAQNPLRGADQVLLLSTQTYHIADRHSRASLLCSKAPRLKPTTYHICPYIACVYRSAYIFKNGSSRIEFPYTLEPSGMQRETSNTIALQYQTMCKYLIYRLPKKSNSNQNST